MSGTKRKLPSEPPSREHAENKANSSKSARISLEHKERAYVAASRRHDRTIDARVVSARHASHYHQMRTGRSLRITAEVVLAGAMYEEEEDSVVRKWRRHHQDARDTAGPGPGPGPISGARAQPAGQRPLVAGQRPEGFYEDIDKQFDAAFPSFAEQLSKSRQAAAPAASKSRQPTAPPPASAAAPQSQAPTATPSEVPFEWPNLFSDESMDCDPSEPNREDYHSISTSSFFRSIVDTPSSAAGTSEAGFFASPPPLLAESGGSKGSPSAPSESDLASPLSSLGFAHPSPIQVSSSIQFSASIKIPPSVQVFPPIRVSAAVRCQSPPSKLATSGSTAEVPADAACADVTCFLSQTGQQPFAEMIPGQRDREWSNDCIDIFSASLDFASRNREEEDASEISFEDFF